MSPVSPVLQSDRKPFLREIVIAKDQPEYLPLPSIVHRDSHMVTTRWRLSIAERLRVLFTGSIYHQQFTFGMKLQPVKMFTEEPSVEECAG